MKKWTLPILATVLALFGAVTLFMSTAVLLDLFGMREREGNYVPFVVGTNFICCLLYLPAAYGVFAARAWSVPLLLGTAFLLVVALAGLLLHIKAGGIYETKTVGALVFRLLLTLLFAGLGSRALSIHRNNQFPGTYHHS